MKQTNEKEWGLMIFQSTFEYLIDGDLNNDQFCELMRCIYNLRQNGELPDMENMDKAVRLVWRSCQHTVRKSIRNANYYSRKKNGEVEEKTTVEPVKKPVKQYDPNELNEHERMALAIINGETPSAPDECSIPEPPVGYQKGRWSVNVKGNIKILSSKRGADIPEIFNACKKWLENYDAAKERREKDSDFDKKYRDYAIDEVHKHFSDFSRDTLAKSYDESKTDNDGSKCQNDKYLSSLLEG